ncbi:Transcriptional regulator, TetR family [Streptococcus sp. DD11]|uniref:TetR/AcrR family transcriptional regulator n=1 Tax=Streptococcus sp. DD11 TaxID=1777879 RepID=UPI000794E976|nr:TetR/AcrR family transcriptional regulator [Streptococcus sp. DD11]KXT82304.1 Transcriptional regulator, TetR family [Streptococcus sp. DD11]
MTQTRQTSTKQDIKEALTQLLLTEKFEDISISKLTRKAGINRGTFYLHYIDKFDMMEQLKQDTFSQLMSIFNDELPIRDNIEATLVYLKENYDFIWAIAKNQSLDFQFSIKEFIKQLLEVIPNAHAWISKIYQIPENYALEVFLASNECIITNWIQTGAKENPKVMTEILLTISHLENMQKESRCD